MGILFISFHFYRTLIILPAETNCMKLILSFLLPVVFTIAGGQTLKTDKVFICDSKTSDVYHSSKNCRGLNRCTHIIIEVTEKQATDNYHKRRCKICY